MKKTTEARSKPAAATTTLPLIATLQARFEANPARHKGITWAKVQARLDAHPAKLKSLEQMEATGGEPDVIGLDKKTGAIMFCDCSADSPKGRRSCCYDREARVKRKEFPPKTSAQEIAAAIGGEILTESQYRELQQLGEFDTGTSSWLQAPAGIRKLGGAIFGDRRFNTVFIYHNGADSYYGSRGVRVLLRV